MAWYTWLDKEGNEFYGGQKWPVDGTWAEQVSPRLFHHGYHVCQTTDIAKSIQAS